MKKEVIIAISIGFVLGLIITFGIYTANRALQQKTRPEPSILTETSPSPLPSPEPVLEIAEPENNLVVDKNKITVSGKTDPERTVAILAENFEELVMSDEEGLFSLEVSLVSGANEIKVIVPGKNGDQLEEILTIVYSTAKIE